MFHDLGFVSSRTNSSARTVVPYKEVKIRLNVHSLFAEIFYGKSVCKRNTLLLLCSIFAASRNYQLLSFNDEEVFPMTNLLHQKHYQLTQVAREQTYQNQMKLYFITRKSDTARHNYLRHKSRGSYRIIRYPTK